ncbi:MAG: hypothetical protein K2I83_00675, partial [Bacteroidales bacterium]|nr:hypothetical protein [Bacteroidales bacterium]
FFFSGLFVQILCGSEFGEATRLLRIMSPVLFFGGMNYLLGIVGLVNLDKSGKFFRNVLLAGITSIVWTLCTASFLGVEAGSWAMTLSETVLFVACLLGLYRLR